MRTADDAIQFIEAHAKNLLLTRDGHAALIQILQAASQQAAKAKEEDAAAERAKGGPG